MNVRDDIDIDDVFKIVKEVSLERSEEIMTIAQKLIKEGMEKGMPQGMEKGIEKGIEKGKIDVAKNLLSLNVELDKIIKATELSEDEIKN